MALTEAQLQALNYCNDPHLRWDLSLVQQQHETRSIKPAKKEKTPRREAAKNNRQKATE